MPKIPDPQTWQQAELLLQPTLIRVVDNLRKYVENSTWESTFQEVTEPYPGHAVCLQRGETTLCYSLWSLCYQVCFLNYEPELDADGTLEVQVDTALLEPDTGEVDWQRLESKTQAMLSTLFANLEAPPVV